MHLSLMTNSLLILCC